MRYTGPKNKLARRVGQDLGLKTATAKLQRRLGIPPGQHGHKGRRKQSDFALQLAEKQKLRLMFGIQERQLRRYYEHAAKTKQATGMMLLQLLERRLDNVVYRLNLVPTRAFARQIVSHGHVSVNNKKLTIPSYHTQIEDTISLSPKALNMPPVKMLLEQKNPPIPSWLTRLAAIGKIIRLPEREDLDANINEQLIVEYYSR